MIGKDKIVMIILFAALVAITLTAGCTAPAQNKDTLYGKDIFNPSQFSMATYMAGIAGNQNSSMELMVLSSLDETDGDRLTTIAIGGDNSSRMDVWLNRSREGINKALITAISSNSIQSASPSASFNVTSMDQTWNTPGSVYKLTGHDSVTVPAGTFDNCSVYTSVKSIQYQNQSVNLSVSYYMHPSSPVPVLYAVQMSGDTLVYALNSFYLPGDDSSTPERTIQSYFDRLGTGDYYTAAHLLTTTDGKQLKDLNSTAVNSLASNMTGTYGKTGEKMAVQYVMTDTVQPVAQVAGHDAVVANWHSIHYDRASGQVYSIEGTFNMVNDGGDWKIIV